MPAPAIFLLAAAAAVHFVPRLGRELSIKDVERVAVVALVVILFDGGMRVGWKRFRRSVVPITMLGVAGHLRHGGPDDPGRPLSLRFQLDRRRGSSALLSRPLIRP